MDLYLLYSPTGEILQDMILVQTKASFSNLIHKRHLTESDKFACNTSFITSFQNKEN